MLRVLLSFWPVLLPLIAYLLWMSGKRRGARRQDNDIPALSDGPLLWVGIATLSVLLACFLWTGFTATPVKGTYVPPHMENGKIAPARVEP